MDYIHTHPQNPCSKNCLCVYSIFTKIIIRISSLLLLVNLVKQKLFQLFLMILTKKTYLNLEVTVNLYQEYNPLLLYW